MRAHLAAAIGGRGGVVVVSGDAGIGKSALVESIIGEAEGQRVRVLTGRAWEFADAPAYFPIRSGLRALGVTLAVPAASDADAFGLWEELLEALARACDRSPILWVLEDLHAADAQTIELLAFLAQPLRAMAALVVATVRTGDARAAGPVLSRLTRLLRDGSTIALGPLCEADVVALAASVAGRELPSSTAPVWMARTGGNPLFVVECARAVRSGRSLERALPETVVEVVVERLRALPSATRGWLEQGAIVGRDFTAATVARAAERMPSVVIDGLLPALRAGLLEEHAPGRFRFAHALVRDAIEEAMPADARRACHARTADALGELGDATEVLVERARHAIAGLGVTPDDAAEAIVLRAVAALESEGARDRAFSLWRRWIDTRGAKLDAALLLEAARLASAAGNYGEAERMAESAGAMARAANDPVRAAMAALARGASPLPGVVNAAHVRALEDAIESLDAEKEPRLARLLRARLAAAMQPAADPGIPVAIAREAIVGARATGDPSHLREVLVLAGSALMTFVDAVETHALAGELLSSSLAANDSPRALRAFSRLVVGHLELGDFAAFDADADRMMAHTRAVGHPSLTWRPLIVASMRALARGQFEDSERFVTEVEQSAALVDDPALSVSLQAHKMYRMFAIDDEGAIRAALATVAPKLFAFAGDLGTLAIQTMFALRLEDREGAAAALPGLAHFARVLPVDSPSLGIVGEAVALAGSNEDRASWLGRLLPFVGREITTAPIPYTYEGPIARAVGLLEASLGRLDAADARLEAARATCRAQRFTPWVARLSLERGRVALAAGRGNEARTLFDEAASTARELGMRGIEAKARAAMGGGARVPVPAPATDPESILLTREGEVWRVAWAARVVRVRDSRGVQLLAKLVASRGERIHALVLAGDGEVALPETDAGEAVDRRAVAAYRARLAMIDDEIASTESGTDARRADRLRRERGMLVEEIARAIGLGGRLRKVGSATERARIAVTRRLKDAVARIAELDEDLGRHLRAEVRTGTYCSYGG